MTCKTNNSDNILAQYLLLPVQKSMICNREPTHLSKNTSILNFD